MKWEGGYLSFGPGSNCEDCGPSEDYAQWYVDDDGRLAISVRYGCYGGESDWVGTVREARQFFRSEIPEWRKAPGKQVRAFLSGLTLKTEDPKATAFHSDYARRRKARRKRA